jgi:23S rRNA (cytosine1962-C5)-methyltransferase
MNSLWLKPGRERSLLRRHPWIFSGAVEKIKGNPAAGETLEVLASNGQFLARAAYSPTSQIRARVWTFDPDEPVDADFFRRRIQTAAAARRILDVPRESDSYRLIYAESDGLPGVIVDRYSQILVIQFLSTGAEAWRETILDQLVEVTGLTMAFERSDADVRELEGLAPRTGSVRGNIGQPLIPIRENELDFQVNIKEGHKTGFYLDQRPNRRRVREMVKDRDVLDCFCYTGGFSVNALAGGARSVLSLDSSSEALTLCRQNVGMQPAFEARHQVMEGEVFQTLRKFRDEDRHFDAVILDPPKFAPTAAHAEKAARGYKDINLLGFKLLRPGGLLITFSCSGGVDAPLFQKIVASAALDAGVNARIVEHLTQGSDHPVALTFPESAYLKGLVCLRD